MVAWVTSGLAVPGVHAASGRTPPGTARGWHSAPELVTRGGTGAAVGCSRCSPLTAWRRISRSRSSPTAARTCLLYTSDAADDLLCVDLGGRRIIKKKK